MKKIIAGGIAVILTFACTACSLLPKEEEFMAAPIVRENSIVTYKYAEVKRGDVELTKKINCTFCSAAEEELGFGVGSEMIENVYVSLGDHVEAGEVLMETNIDPLKSELKEIDYDLRRNRLKIKQLKELIAADPSGEAGYKLQLEEENNHLEYNLLRSDAVEKKIAERQVVAGLTGTVSYVKSDLKGSITKADDTLVRIVSGDEVYFAATKADAGELKDGETIEVTVGSRNYETTVKNDDETDRVLFITNDEDEQPDVGSRGSATIVLDLRADVLYLPKDVIRTIDGKNAVYYENEDGVKDIKYIETGLVGNNYTEVTAGLDFGDLVISE